MSSVQELNQTELYCFVWNQSVIVVYMGGTVGEEVSTCEQSHGLFDLQYSRTVEKGKKYVIVANILCHGLGAQALSLSLSWSSKITFKKVLGSL